MRGLVGGLPSPHPLGAALPAVYQEEDRFTMRLTSAFDDALAPIVSTLDNLPAYLSPGLTPEDFLSWLSDWVAFDLDETWSLARRREAVARAVDILRRRGTSIGLAEEVALVTDGEVEIIENGGTAWSLDPSSPMVGSPKPALIVRVRVDDPAAIDADRLDRVVAAAKPAHVPHRIEILGREEAPKARRARVADATAAAKEPPDKAGAKEGRGGAAPKAADPPDTAPPDDAPDDASGGRPTDASGGRPTDASGGPTEGAS
jgi:phage tail-like protein